MHKALGPVDTENWLNGLGNTAVYVIERDTRRFLFANERLKRVRPNVTAGMTCREIWAGSCIHCPLDGLGGKNGNTIIRYNTDFGEVVSVTATPVLWRESVPAYMITVTPLVVTDEVREAAQEQRRLSVLAMQMMKAATTAYDMVILVNLSRNAYEMVEYENFINHTAPRSGTFDELIEAGVSTLPEEDRPAFRRAFSRENLLAAHARGEVSVYLEHHQVDDRGGMHWLSTEVLFVDDPHSDDVLEITLSRVIDHQKSIEQRLSDERAFIYDSLPGDVVRVLFNERLTILGYPEGYTRRENPLAWPYDGIDVIHPDDRERILRHTRAAAAARRDLSIEYRHVPHMGETRWFNAMCRCIGEQDGVPLYLALILDVSERKRAEEEQERERIRELERSVMFDMLPCGVVQCRMDDVLSIVDHSEAFARIFGMDKGRAVSMGELFHPEDRAAAIGELLAHADKGAPFVTERRCLTAAGTSLWARVEGRKIREQDGRAVYLCVIVDISEQKKYMQSLREERLRAQKSEELLRLGLQATKISTFVYDPARREARLSSPPLESYPVPEVFGNMPEAFAEEFVYPEDRKLFCEMYESVNKGKRVASADVRWRAGLPWMRVTLSALDGDEENPPTKVVGLTEDITQDKRDQAVIRRHAEVLQALGREYFAIYFIDLELDTVQLLHASPTMVVELGIEEESTSYSSTLEAYIERHVFPKDREAFRAVTEIQRLRELREPTEISFLRVREDQGKVEWVQMKVIVSREKSGRPRWGTLALRSIDGQMRHEMENRRLMQDALRRAELASTAKTEFLSRMSHDIRTPMNAIIGMTALASARVNDAERVRYCLSKINVASTLLLELINGVLDMSKIESGKLDLERRDFNISDLAAEVLTVLQPPINARGQRLGTMVHDVRHEDFVGDPVRLKQVLVNLLSNANKYTPDNGEIRLTIAEKDGPREGFGLLEFTVEDNGIGMAPDFLERVFEPFSRAEDSRVSKSVGSGLGMSISRSIIEMMGGEIKVESVPGKGTRVGFSVCLECRAKEAEDMSGFRGLSVLVIDDEPGERETLSAMLDALGMRSFAAASVEDAARELAAGRDSDAILLDWKVSGADGMEAVRAVREASPARVPLILLAHEWSGVEKEARAAGVDAFLVKPVFLSRLVRALKSAVSGDARSDAESGPADFSALAGRRILLVEDNELNAEIARELLRAAGMEADVAVNGLVAVERFTSVPEGYYDIILMDVQMPVMNGYEACRAIRSLPSPHAARIPIVAMTANAFSADVTEALESGMNDHIAKPVDVKRLYEVLGALLARKAPSAR